MDAFIRLSRELYRADEDSRLYCAFVGWTIEPKGRLQYVRVRKQHGAIVGAKKFFPQLKNVTTRQDLERFPLIVFAKDAQQDWDRLLNLHTGGFVVRDIDTLRRLILDGYGIGD